MCKLSITERRWYMNGMNVKVVFICTVLHTYVHKAHTCSYLYTFDNLERIKKNNNWNIKCVGVDSGVDIRWGYSQLRHRVPYTDTPCFSLDSASDKRTEIPHVKNICFKKYILHLVRAHSHLSCSHRAFLISMNSLFEGDEPYELLFYTFCICKGAFFIASQTPNEKGEWKPKKRRL